MKKYTNKILIIAAAILLAAITIKFFMNANEIKMQLKQNVNKEKTTNN
jgi:hypothetical protein